MPHTEIHTAIPTDVFNYSMNPNLIFRYYIFYTLPEINFADRKAA